MGLMSSIAGAAASIGANIYSAKQSQKYSKRLMNIQNAFNSEEAEKQRKWEENMANTAHQREMGDLEKAGLNPVISANSGAVTPSGATATSGQQSAARVANLGDTLSNAINAYSTAKQADLAEKKTPSEIKKNIAESKKITSEAVRNNILTPSEKKQIDKYTDVLESEKVKNSAQVGALNSQSAKNMAEIGLMGTEKALKEAETQTENELRGGRKWGQYIDNARNIVNGLKDTTQIFKPTQQTSAKEYHNRKGRR